MMLFKCVCACFIDKLYIYIYILSHTDPASGLSQDFGRGIAGVIFSFTPELRDRDANGTRYGFEAPATEIDPSFREMWNGYVAMFAAIDDYNDRMTPTVPPTCPVCSAAPVIYTTNVVIIATALLSALLM